MFTTSQFIQKELSYIDSLCDGSSFNVVMSKDQNLFCSYQTL